MTEWTVRLAALPALELDDDDVGRLRRAIEEGPAGGRVVRRGWNGSVEVRLRVVAASAAAAAHAGEARVVEALRRGGVRELPGHGVAGWLAVAPGGDAGEITHAMLEGRVPAAGEPGPPRARGVLPVTLPLDLVLVRSPDVALAVASASVGPDAWELRLVGARRRGAARAPAWRASFSAAGDAGLRLDVRYAGVRELPRVRCVTARVDTEELDATVDVAPLPPPGPVDLVLEWPALGVGPARAVVDGDAVRAAAARSRPLLA